MVLGIADQQTLDFIFTMQYLVEEKKNNYKNPPIVCTLREDL
jgi:hypothetical protein